jgi:glycosyltransferase involved in cell wall biosynthesis
MGVSIILPTYNDGHFLANAISSCMNQCPDVEVIIIDDASTTPLPEDVTRRIDDKHIRYIRHETNKGLAAARNTAISQSKHDLIIPLDADDHFFPNVVSRMVNQMDDNTDVVYGDVFDNNIHKPKIQPFTEQMFKEDNPLFCSSLFRKSLWEKVGGYMEREGPHYEDWNFWARCFKSGARFKYIPLKIYNHQSRPDGMLRILHPNRDFYRELATKGVFE